MQVDLTSSRSLSRTDGYLLLLGAQNAILFREEFEIEIISRATRDLQNAMYRLRTEKGEKQ
jgi:hypothetical protein